MELPRWVVAAAIVGGTLGVTASPSPAQEGDTLRVVMLGTGTPNADPTRSGPAVAVLAGGRSYLVDAGPGIVRRASAAAAQLGEPALRPSRLSRLFLTHLHSDHTVGIPDLLLSTWVLEREGPLQVIGPPGTGALFRHVESAWAEDIRNRIEGREPANPTGFRSEVREIDSGVVYQDDVVRVTAFRVPHGDWEPGRSFGYRFEGGGRVIVISGDTRPGDAVVEACRGCDVLVHEVYSGERLTRREPEWQTYHRGAHTSAAELADIATRARPKLLVLYHQLYWGATDEDLIRELRVAGYSGPVVSARDLDRFP